MLAKEASDLLQELKKCKDARERERLRALYAISVGYQLSAVAEIFSVDEGTLYRWMERWREERKLSDKPKRGRPCSFTEEDTKRLVELLIEGDPQKHGIDASFWNTKELMEYFARRGRFVSQETIRRRLKEIGAKYVKAGREDTDSEGKETEIEIYTKRFIEDMKYNPHLLSILLENEELAQCPVKRCGWTFEKKFKIRKIPKEKTPEGPEEDQESFEKRKKLIDDEKKRLDYIKLSKK